MNRSFRPVESNPDPDPDEARSPRPDPGPDPDATPREADPSGDHPGCELNGTFLRSYDAQRAEPRRTEAPAWFRLQALRARGTSLVFQAAEGEDAGPESTAAEPSPRRSVPELILDEDNLLPFHFLRTGDRLGRAVVKIQRGDGAAGTGFLVAAGILLTNHHVLPDAATAAAARAHTNYEVVPPPDPGGRVAVVPLRPDLLFLTEPDLDVTFCGVEGLDDLGAVPLGRDSLNILPSEPVNIIQHPRGRPKEVALQDNRVVKVDNVVLQYRCDTEPGSSGSPVFNNQWQLVALHHASVVSDGDSGRPAHGLYPGSRFLNEGIRVSAIAVWLETFEAETPEDHEHAERLRGIFGGLDPQVGFFGALGRPRTGGSAAESVVECYNGDAADLDLAFWNLSTVTPNPCETVAEIGWVIAHMKVDAWCLTHADRDVLGALCDHMQGHFRLDHRFLLAGEADEPPVAVLYRRSAMLSARWVRPDGEGGPRPGPHLLLRVADGRGRVATVALVPVLRGRRGKARRLELGASDPTAELLYFGDGLSTRELHALSGSGVPLRAALGPDGAFALLAGPDNRFGTIFASPNLDLTYGLSSGLVVARHRRWPEALDSLGGRRPIAVRLSFSQQAGSRAPEPAPPIDEPAPACEPAYRADAPETSPPPVHLEQALREILAWIEDETRRSGRPPRGA